MVHDSFYWIQNGQWMDDLCDPEKMYESIKISSYVRVKVNSEYLWVREVYFLIYLNICIIVSYKFNGRWSSENYNLILILLLVPCIIIRGKDVSIIVLNNNIYILFEPSKLC